MLEILWLIMAHFIGDIALQSDWQAKNKGKYWYVLMSHSIIWATCICVALVYIGRFEYWKFFFLFGLHAGCDFIKANQPENENTWWHIYTDQCFHFIQIIIVYIL